MRQRQILVTVLAALIAFVPLCASEKAEMDVLRSNFEKTTKAFDQALRTNDADRLFTYVADDVSMMPPNEAPVKGKAAMQAWYRSFLASFRTTALNLTDVEITVSDDWATTAGQYEWTLQPTAGGDPVVDKGHYMQIWKRGPDGSWRFFREIWNSSMPVASAAKP